MSYLFTESSAEISNLKKSCRIQLNYKNKSIFIYYSKMSDNHSDPIVRDKKQLSLSGSAAFPQFFFRRGRHTSLAYSLTSLCPGISDVCLCMEQVNWIWKKQRCGIKYKSFLWDWNRD